MYLRKRRGYRGATAAVSLAGVLVALFASEGYGQSLRVNQPSASGLGGVANVGQIGNTGVARHFGQNAPFTVPRGATPLRQNAQQLMGMSRQYSMFRQRRGGSTGLSLLSAGIYNQQSVSTSWHKRLATGGAARYVRQPPRLGAAGAGGAPGVDRALSNLILQPQALLQTTAFLGPMSGLTLPIGGVRDAMSAIDQTTSAPYAMQSPSPETRHTQSELMASRLEVLRQRALKDAWKWFKADDFERARSAFESAEMLDRSDPEPRAGAFFCLVADRRYAQAQQNFNRIIRYDMGKDRNPFKLDFGLAQRYSTPRRMRLDVREFMDFNDAQENPVGLYGALCYLLWHADLREEALRGAQHLIQNDSGGQAGWFGRMILAAAKEEGVVPTE